MKTKTETNRSPLGFPSGSFPERPARRETGYWRWGSDNLFPNALAAMSRLSTTHRRIINDKADYISGKGFVCDRENPALIGLVERANGCGESLRQVFNKVAFDKALFGNAFLEVVTDSRRSFLSTPRAAASQGTTGMRSCTTTGRPTTPDGPGSYRSTRCSSPPKTARCAA